MFLIRSVCLIFNENTHVVIKKVNISKIFYNYNTVKLFQILIVVITLKGNIYEIHVFNEVNLTF